MKLTLFIDSLYGGGAERVTCNLANFLVQQGHQVEILTMSETEESYELDAKVRVRSLLLLKERKGKIWNTVIRFPRLWKHLKATNNDAYIVMLPKTTIMLLMFKFLTSAKIIAAERADPAAYSKRTSYLLKKYAPKADGWVFQTEDACAWYGESIQNTIMQVIPNAINPAFIRPLYAGPHNKEIVAVGRLNKQKNFALLIDAFSSVASAYPDYRLIIYGEGPNRKKLEERIIERGLENRVSLPGNVTNIADKMQTAEMFVLSSDFEGMPNALMEAMALGLPCIATNCPVGGPKYLVQNGENGILVPVKDKKALIAAIKSILSDETYAKVMGCEARKISQKLDPEIVYGEWETFISKLVEP